MALEQSGDMTAAFTSALSSATETPAVAAPPAAAPEAQSSASDSTPAAATAQPEAQTQTPESVSTEPSKAGEPPAWRWQDILANTRETVAKETEARVRQTVEQQYQWAKDIAEQERDGLLTWRRAMNGDPAALAHIKANPQVVQWLKGLVSEPAQPAPDPEPEPDLQAPDGTLVYSAARQRDWREWNNRQLTSTLTTAFEAKLQPLQHVAQTLQEREAQARAWTDVGQVLTEFRADPEFKAHEADVKAELAQDAKLAELADRDPKLALEIAYGRVFKAKVLPTHKKTDEATVLANLQQRAVQGTVNPNAATASTPKKFKPGEQGFAEALAHFGS